MSEHDVLAAPTPPNTNDYIPVNEDNILNIVSSHPLKQSEQKLKQSGEEPKTQAKEAEGRGSLDMIRRSIDFVRIKSIVTQNARNIIDQPSKRHGSSGSNTQEVTMQSTSNNHAVAGTASLAEHLLIRSLDKDFAKLLVLQIISPCVSYFRSDLNRLELLALCREAGPALGTSRAFSKEKGLQGGMKGSLLQLRDLRCLQVFEAVELQL